MKPKLLIRVTDDEAKGDFVIEYNSVNSLAAALDKALPYLLASGGVFQAKQVNFDLQLSGVRLQKQQRFPESFTLSACLAALREAGQQYSSYGVQPGQGYVFNLI